MVLGLVQLPGRSWTSSVLELKRSSATTLKVLLASFVIMIFSGHRNQGGSMTDLCGRGNQEQLSNDVIQNIVCMSTIRKLPHSHLQLT